MSDKVYHLPYDEMLDNDISSWLNNLPRSRKAEIVRNALRFYLKSTRGEYSPVAIAKPLGKNKTLSNPKFDIDQVVQNQLEVFNWVKKAPKHVDDQLLISMLYSYLKKDFSIKGDHWEILQSLQFKGLVIKRYSEGYKLFYVDFSLEYNDNLLEVAYPLYTNTHKEQVKLVSMEYSKELIVIDFDDSPSLIKRKIVSYKIFNHLNYELKSVIDEIFSASDFHLIPKGKSGVYFLFDHQYNLVYVGKAKSLKDRVTSHVKGLTHTKGYYESFESIGLMYVDNYEEESDLIEKDFIRNFSPAKNIQLK